MKKLHSDIPSECNYSFLEAKTKLESWCAYQERCQFEVEQKLASWKFFGEQRDQLISDLIVHNFLNEERFASAYVSGKFRIKRWGRVKISIYLKQKHISTYSINNALKEIDGDEYWESLLHLAERKHGELSSKTGDVWQIRQKLYRFLSSKGYESDLIAEAVKQIAL
jgi:regulatory protein